MTRFLFTLEEFKKKYYELKKHGDFDRKIANALYISEQTLYRYKKKCGLVQYTKRPTQLPITEEQLQKGEQLGLTRRIMYKRIRNCYWTPEEACSIPKLKKGVRRPK